MNQSDLPLLLTYQQAAELLGFKSHRTVRRMVEEGLLFPVRPTPRRPRIRKDDLLAYVDSLGTRRYATVQEGVDAMKARMRDTGVGRPKRKSEAEQKKELDDLLALIKRKKR